MNNTTLHKLSKTLNDSNITWGIGGSTLLEYYGLPTTPDDLDLWIHPEDIGKAKRVFEKYEHINTNIYLPEKYHFKIHFYDIEVDFVSCFMIKPNQYKFSFYITPNHLRYIKMNELDIPVTYLEDWYIIYKLLKRDDKAKLIEEYFNNASIEMSVDALNLSLNDKSNTIPIKILKSVQNISQLSLFNTNEEETTHDIYLFSLPQIENIEKQSYDTELNNYEQLSIFDYNT